MYTSISIKNFRCFVEADVPLRPLTVLIGQNDTGKSAFLHALKMAATHQQIEAPFDIWKLNKSKKDVNITAKNSDTVISQSDYRISPIHPNSTGSIERSHLGTKMPVVDFDLPSSGPKMVSQGIPDSSDTPPLLNSNGENVPALIDIFIKTR
jgi:hypothetical protein